MNVIFLDVDGVLNDTCTTVGSPDGYRGVSEQYIKLLKIIADELHAEIVLSSDWRSSSKQDFAYLMDSLNKYGLFIYSKTPEIHWRVRGKEILEWLDSHEDVNDYIILDDNIFDFLRHKELSKHVILTDDGLENANPLIFEPCETVSKIISLIDNYREKDNE